MKKMGQKKGIRQLHTVYPEHSEMVLKLVEGPHGFGSGSDVVRKAIVELYNKFYPPYKGPTYKQKKEEDEEKAFDSITNEQFATETVKGVLVSDTAGNQFVMIHWGGNSLNNIPLETIKEWAKENPGDLAFHLETLKTLSMGEAMSSPYWKQVWEHEHGIIWE